MSISLYEASISIYISPVLTRQVSKPHLMEVKCYPKSGIRLFTEKFNESIDVDTQMAADIHRYQEPNSLNL